MSNARNLANLLGTNATIQTAKIADDAITNAKIAQNTITANEISNNAITNAKIAANTITANEILGGAITNAKIKENTITTSEILDGAITNDKIITISGEKIVGDISWTCISGVVIENPSNATLSYEIIESSDTAGSIGNIRFDMSYLYIHVGGDGWMRAALASIPPPGTFTISKAQYLTSNTYPTVNLAANGANNAPDITFVGRFTVDSANVASSHSLLFGYDSPSQYQWFALTWASDGLYHHGGTPTDFNQAPEFQHEHFYNIDQNDNKEIFIALNFENHNKSSPIWYSKINYFIKEPNGSWVNGSFNRSYQVYGGTQGLVYGFGGHPNDWSDQYRAGLIWGDYDLYKNGDTLSGFCGNIRKTAIYTGTFTSDDAIAIENESELPNTSNITLYTEANDINEGVASFSA